MAITTTEHYRTYTPKPFTRAERDSVTILFGGLHWRLERILQAVLENSGYKARILPVATKEDLLTGREVADIGQCCPISFTTGNLVNFLKKESQRIGPEEVNKRYVYLTAGSCGACRFGQYIRATSWPCAIAASTRSGCSSWPRTSSTRRRPWATGWISTSR